MKCLEQAIHNLKNKFHVEGSNLPEFFPSHEVSSWKNRLKKGRNVTLMQGEDEPDLLKDTFPIPRQHSIRTRLHPVGQHSPQSQQEAARRTDLLSIARFLFGRDRYSDLLKILLTFLAIGRGGEIKFLSCAAMFFCTTHRIVFAQWFQRKTCKTNPSGFAPDFEHPELCCFLLFGCYWSLEGGLMRPGGLGLPNTPERRTASFVFQDLHQQADNSVAKDLTAIIRACIPKVLWKLFSVKSLRCGSMTQLAWDPAVTHEESIALGGWAFSSNASKYMWCYLVSIIPPILTLSGYNDARVLPYLPTAGMLFHSGPMEDRINPDQWQLFVSKLYTIQLPEFQPPHGRLRQWLVVVSATMIMHFDYMYRKYGHTNRYVSKMINTMITSELAPDVNQAIGRLQRWSKVTLADFKKGNLTGHDDDADNVLRRRTTPDQVAKMNQNVASVLQFKHEMQQKLNEQSIEMNRLGNEVSQVRTSQQRTNEQISGVVTQNRWLIQQMKLMQDQLRQMTQLLLNSSATTQGATLTPETPNNFNAAPPPSPPAIPTPPSPPQRSPEVEQEDNPSPPLPPPPPPPRDLNQALQRVGVRNVVRKRGQRSDFEKVKYALRTVHEQPRNNVFAPMAAKPMLSDLTAWVHTNIFQGRGSSTNRGSIHKVLTLVDAMWTTEERENLRNHRLEAMDMIRLCDKIDKDVVRCCHVLKKRDKLPKSAEPMAQASSAMLGAANNLSLLPQSELEKFVPNWNALPHKNQKPCTLLTWIGVKQDDLRRAMHQKKVQDRYRNS